MILLLFDKIYLNPKHISFVFRILVPWATTSERKCGLRSVSAKNQVLV